jgi:hypothetical protein
MKLKSQSLFEEVHTIAFNYHWSEKDILSLTTAKRQMYVQMIEKNLKKMINS